MKTPDAARRSLIAIGSRRAHRDAARAQMRVVAARRAAGARRARPRPAPPEQRRHLHDGHRAPRRREQRPAGHAQSRPGLSAPRSPRRRAATADRTRSVRSCSKRSACCAPRSWRRCTASTARSSTSRAPSTSAISFSIEETFEKWGRDEIIGDYVRLIRTVRPDVITGLSPDRRRRRPASSGLGGPRARGVQARRRSDEVSGTDQGRARPGSRRSSTSPPRCGDAGGAADAPAPDRCRSTCRGYDRLLGKTYAEIGTEARSMHKCQGTAQLLSLARSCGGGISWSKRRCRTDCSATSVALRRHRHVDRRARAVCRRRVRRRTDRRPRRDRHRRAERAAALRHRERRGHAAAAAHRLARRARAARAAARLPIDDSGRFEIDYRLARRSASSSRRFCSPTASASKRWPTTAWSCRASRCASRCSSPTAARADVPSSR